MTDYAALFDTLYASDDPYGYRTRWFEARKRALLLACLPRQRFGSTWELGCSNGELTAALATRSDRVYATDRSQRAVDLARERLHALGHVEVAQAIHPASWPPDRFDLIVFSEVGFYLPVDALTDTIARLVASLAPDGVLVASHWTRPFPEGSLSGEEVHATIDRQAGLPRVFRYRDADFITEGWSAARESVAEREGIA